jgi:hypothetical protein
MKEKFSSIKKDFLERWTFAVQQVGIPQIAYNPQVKIINDTNSNYSIGVIFNPHRFERLNPKTEEYAGCKLCAELRESSAIPSKNLAPNISENFMITYNAFPHMIGSSMAIARNKESEEKAMYNTKNLSGLLLEMEEIFSIADELGLKVFHNTFGAGATIPNHEHWHLLNLNSAYDKIGNMYGFDAAEKVESKKIRGIKTMPNFPFAHLIFDSKDLEWIVHFLNNLGNNLGKNYPYDSVPHSICQGQDGILIVPNKIHKDKCMGVVDIAGHYFGCKSQEEFESITFKEYIFKLDEILFKKEDINLERFL